MTSTGDAEHIPATSPSLSRREREILDVLYRLGEGAVEDVRTELGGRPHYSTVRAMLRVLEEKGHIHHREERLRYVYMPLIPKREAAQSALEHLVKIFFDDSPEQVLPLLLNLMSPRVLQQPSLAMENTPGKFLTCVNASRK